ncbi:RNA polymerase III RPC4-domain-containing protein [Cyathus striatus]|nr:RNA polymerase III RPC4-domain-containing protein [Cyathus striatus]
MSSHQPDNPPTSQKAIGSLAKKQSDVTRQGAHKLKFIPTLPNRRKKESEPTPAEIPPSSSSERPARGRGRGDGRGRGRGRGAAPPILEMTASGPFAMGPALAGSSSRRIPPKSAFVPSVPSGASSSSALGAGLSQTAAPSLKKEFGADKGKGKAERTEGEEEVYSEPDEGVEIIDMQHVYTMDFMAPEIIQKEHQAKKIKKESAEAIGSESDGEEEEELEDIIDEFSSRTNIEENGDMEQERLYLFQFPEPFPTFTSNQTSTSTPLADGKKVSFAFDDNDSSISSNLPADAKIDPPEVVDGCIGALEVYRNGTVKMRLANNILLDVNAATQPSFLQHAVQLDQTSKRLVVLGEIDKQFVVSPNVKELLEALEGERKIPSKIEGEDGLIKMDVI